MTRLLLAAAAIGSAIYVLRRRRRTKDRIDLYYDDGSMVTLEPGTVEAGRIAPLAGDVVRAARPTAPTQ